MQQSKLQKRKTLESQKYQDIDDNHHYFNFEDGSRPHEFSSASAYYCQTFFEACDLLSVELKDRFEDKHVPPVLAMEETLL